MKEGDIECIFFYWNDVNNSKAIQRDDSIVKQDASCVLKFMVQ